MKFHSTKILILIIICNLAALAGYYFLFGQIKTQSRAAASLISVIDLGQQKDSHLSALRSVVKDTDTERQQLVTYLLPNDSEVSFIEQIETLAKNSGLAAKTNNVSSAAGTDMTKTFQMQMETTGSWNSTLYFLNQVENLPYNIHIQDFTLNKPSATWVATINLSITEKK